MNHPTNHNDGAYSRGDKRPAQTPPPVHSTARQHAPAPAHGSGSGGASSGGATPLKVAVACDHRGYEGKKKLLPILHRLGHQVHDFGCDSTAACDYPDFAAPAARAVGCGQFDVGILLDGSGIGMSIVANKCENVRAALAHDELTARRSREHNHCNVLCLGTDLLGDEHIRAIVEMFLSTPYTRGRHDGRVEKIRQLELEIARALLAGEGRR